MAKRARRRRGGGRHGASRRDREARRLAETRDALDRFETHLAGQGIGPASASAHAERARAFGIEYMLERAGRTPMDAIPGDVLFYMGVWFPYHYHGSMVPEVGRMLDTLWRWFSFLRSEGRVSVGDLEAVRNLVRRRRTFEERFETFVEMMASDAFEEGDLDDWVHSLDAWPVGPDPPDVMTAPELGTSTQVPPDLLPILEAHGVGGLPLLRDLRLLVGHVSEDGLRLTDVNGWLPLRELRALNSQRSAPEPIDGVRGQPDLPVLHALVEVLRALHVLQEDGGRRLLPGPARTAFLSEPGERQYWAVATTFWHGLVWWLRFPSLDPEAAEWAQDLRYLLAALVLRLEPSDIVPGSSDALTRAMGRTGMVLGTVVPMLAALGMVEDKGAGLGLATVDGEVRFVPPTALGREVLPRLCPGMLEDLGVAPDPRADGG